MTRWLSDDVLNRVVSGKGESLVGEIERARSRMRKND